MSGKSVESGDRSMSYRPIVYSLLRQRDGSACILCGHPIENGTESVDHILQRALGGSNEASNVRLVHLKCNNHRPRKGGVDKSARERLFLLLARLPGPGPQTLNFHSLSMGMNVTPGLLSRYLREARQAGWVQTEVVLGGVKVTVLNRLALEAASGEKP